MQLVPLVTNRLATRLSLVEVIVHAPTWLPVDIEVTRLDGAAMSLSLTSIDVEPHLLQRDFDAAELLARDGRTDTSPGEPTNLHVVFEDARSPHHVLYWNRPDGDAVVSGYQLQLGWFPGTAERAEIELGPQETSHRLLWHPRERLYARLLARNAAGTSPPSNEIVLDLPTPSAFDSSIAAPAYSAGGPRVLLDQAHHNHMDANDHGRPLLDLLRNDGYRVHIHHEPFDAAALADVDVLIIANPYAHATENWYHRGYEWWKWSEASAVPAFTAAEIGAVVDFVSGGGNLLLAVGGAPWAGAAGELAAALGVDFRNADTRAAQRVPEAEFESRGLRFVSAEMVEQMRQANAAGGQSNSAGQANPAGQASPASQADPARAQDHGTLGAHAISSGDGSDSQRLWTVLTYLGQSIVGPPGSISLLELPDDAVDWLKDRPGGEWRTLSAAGRSQAVAFELGAGRVVVVGDAAVFFARPWRAGSIAAPMGMAWPERYVPREGVDATPMPMNRQFALNVMHWLSGALR